MDKGEARARGYQRTRTVHKKHCSPLAAALPRDLRLRRLGRLGYEPIGLIVAQHTAVRRARQTSHLRVAFAFGEAATGRPLPSDPIGLIVAQHTAVRRARQTSHLRVAFAFGEAATGRPLPSDPIGLIAAQHTAVRRARQTSHLRVAFAFGEAATGRPLPSGARSV